jgi:hypothetical protein
MDALQSGRITGNPEVIAGSVSGNANVADDGLRLRQIAKVLIERDRE